MNAEHGTRTRAEMDGCKGRVGSVSALKRYASAALSLVILAAACEPVGGGGGASSSSGEGGSGGPGGATGPAGSVSTHFAVGAGILGLTLNQTLIVEAKCPDLGSGTRILDGGFDTSVQGSQTGEVTVNFAIPVAATDTTPALYRVKFTRTRTAVAADIVVTAHAICTP